MNIPVFYSYSHKDDLYRKELETHLELLRRSNLIEGWSDREIAPGSDWEEEINFNIQKAKIILILLSPDFIASDYCYETETIFALEQHEKKEATVIPIIIRPCLWKLSQFKKLQVLPKAGQAVTIWGDRDSAWLDVAEGIIKVIEELRAEQDNTSTNDTGTALGSISSARAKFLLGENHLQEIDTTEYLFDENVPVKNIQDVKAGSVETKKESLSNLLYRFLKEYKVWYFSPLRINKWGGRQVSYEDLSESTVSKIKKELISLEKKGLVKTTKSKKGNVIYKVDA